MRVTTVFLQQKRVEWGGKVGCAETWEQFDALPVMVKRCYWYADRSYTALPAFHAIDAGKATHRIAARLRAGFAEDRRRECLAMYGPEHLQAGA